MDEESRRRKIRLLTRGMGDVSQPEIQVDMMDMLRLPFEIQDVTDDPKIPLTFRNDIKRNPQLAMFFFESPFTPGHIYKARFMESQLQIHEFMILADSSDATEGSAALTSDIGRHKFKRLLSIYITAWDNQARLSRNSAVTKTIQVIKRYTSASGTTFDQVTRDESSTASDFYLTRPIDQADEMWAGRDDEWRVTITGGALYYDVFMYIQTR